MCGISGFNWKDEKILNQMMESIKHRGPDDQGKYINKNISLGHNRLSIIDLSEKGKNPIWNQNKTKCIIYNGEIYNYKEIKEKLIKKGYEFYTKTDTEVILNGYEEYGKDILDMLNGMFAFAIYDLKNKSLFLARDRLGIKPLYYYYKNGKFIFASEIKALLKLLPKDIINYFEHLARFYNEIVDTFQNKFENEIDSIHYRKQLKKWNTEIDKKRSIDIKDYIPYSEMIYE